MKTRLDTAERTAKPNRPTLGSHARTRRAGLGRVVRGMGCVGLLRPLDHGCVGIGPDGVGGAPALAGTGVVAGEAEIEGEGPLDGFDHFENGRGTMQFLELEPAGVAAV